MSNGEHDYYQILEITKEADIDTIKQQYKKLARKWHPDKNLDNKEEAENMFKSISEAYEILSDPVKRKIYDEHGIEGLKESFSESRHRMDPFELFSEMMGMSDNVPDVVTNISLSLEELYLGSVVKKSIERATFCDKCKGKGTKHGVEPIKCKHCNGNGYVMIRHGPFMSTSECRHCQGTCMDPKTEKCKKCRGQTFFTETIELNVDIPIGSHDQYPIIVNEQGNAIPANEIMKSGGKIRSDAVFIISEKEHPVFKRFVTSSGNVDFSDLKIDLEVSFLDSIIGINKDISHLDGHKINIRLLCPIRHGDIFVMRNEGMPKLSKPSEKGDLFINFEVQHPEKLSNDKIQQVYLLLSGKTMPNIENNNSSETNLIPFSKYIFEENIKAKNSNIHNKYKHRKHKKRNKKSNEKSNSSDSDDNTFNNGMPQQQCHMQ